MIEIKNLHKKFGDTAALDGADIHVPRGAVYGLVGPNGAGKSTIIRHLAGIYRQDSGEVRIDGQPVFENTDIKKRVAYFPDELYFYLQASTFDMMKFFKGIYPNFSAERYERLRGLFSFSDKTLIRQLSRGMRKQAYFWLLMSMRPEVIILDEPVDGLDPIMRRQVWSVLLGDAAENGTTIMVSSHNLRELEDVCDHVGLIHRGRTILEKSLSDIQDNIVKVQVVFHDGAGAPENLEILHEESVGKVRTIIARESIEEVKNKFAAADCLYYEVIPLTLEEVFIYELGGSNYEFSKIII
jgi:ABC-2 type transport system ATP-binding protein